MLLFIFFVLVCYWLWLAVRVFSMSDAEVHALLKKQGHIKDED